MGKSIDAVIFDLDGVITDTAEFHFMAWQALAEELAIPLSRSFNEQLKGISRMDSLERILACGHKSGSFTPEEKRELARKKNEHYCKLIERISPADILPGIASLLSEIKSHHIRLGVASVSKNALTVMRALGLSEQFDLIVDANRIRHGKPHPEIFLTAAQGLGVDPAACVGIEDAAAGIESIIAAGMFAVAVGKDEALTRAHLLVGETKKLSFGEIQRQFLKWVPGG